MSALDEFFSKQDKKNTTKASIAADEILKRLEESMKLQQDLTNTGTVENNVEKVHEATEDDEWLPFEDDEIDLNDYEDLEVQPLVDDQEEESSDSKMEASSEKEEFVWNPIKYPSEVAAAQAKEPAKEKVAYVCPAVKALKKKKAMPNISSKEDFPELGKK